MDTGGTARDADRAFYLRERKRRLPHGAWLSWLDEHFDGDVSRPRRWTSRRRWDEPEVVDGEVSRRPLDVSV